MFYYLNKFSADQILFLSTQWLNELLCMQSRCVICQMRYKRGDRQINFPCKHIYHTECGSKWLSINKVYVSNKSGLYVSNIYRHFLSRFNTYTITSFCQTCPICNAEVHLDEWSYKMVNIVFKLAQICFIGLSISPTIGL